VPHIPQMLMNQADHSFINKTMIMTYNLTHEYNIQQNKEHIS
jgi:hypothetical protein